MDIRRIVQGVAYRASNSRVLEVIEDYVLDKLYEKPILKEKEKEHEEIPKEEIKEIPEEEKVPKHPRG